MSKPCNDEGHGEKECEHSQHPGSLHFTLPQQGLSTSEGVPNTANSQERLCDQNEIVKGDVNPRWRKQGLDGRYDEQPTRDERFGVSQFQFAPPWYSENL